MKCGERPRAAPAEGEQRCLRGRWPRRPAVRPDRRPYLVGETPVRWRIEPTGSMRVPGVVFASRRLLADAAEDQSLRQVANVATLPGIVAASYAMPDVHWGYGFPIGGVAATDVDAGGVVSPGGVGFDISCGVRLLVSGLDRDQLAGRLPALMDAFDRLVPRGLGGGGVWQLTGRDRLRPHPDRRRGLRGRARPRRAARPGPL